MEKRAGGCLGFLIGTVILVGSLFEWDEFLAKPFRQLSRQSLGWVAADLIHFRSETYEQPGQGWMFLVAASALTLLFFVLFVRLVKSWLAYLARADAPISILDTVVHIRVSDPDMRIAEVRRSQTVHANGPRVDAYHYKITATYGNVVNKSWSFESRVDGQLVSARLIPRYMGKSLEMVEWFTEPLPWNRLVKYLPRAIALPAVRTFECFPGTIVRRSTTVTMENEYNSDNPMFQITCVRYPAYNVEIIVDLPEQTNKTVRDFEGLLITDNAVEAVPVLDKSSLPHEAGRRVYSIKRRRLTKLQAIRLQWITETP